MLPPDPAHVPTAPFLRQPVTHNSSRAGRHGKIIRLSLNISRISKSLHKRPKPRIRRLDKVLKHPVSARAGVNNLPPVGILQGSRIAEKTKSGLAPLLIRNHQDDATLRDHPARPAGGIEMPDLPGA